MFKRSVLLLWIVLAVFAALASAGCKELSASLSQGLAPAGTQKSAEASRLATDGIKAKPAGVVIKNEVMGRGQSARPGDRVTVNITGRLPDGAEFDPSPNGKQPFSFTLGAGTVIPGLERGIVGMMAGGKRKVTVPPSFAYGAKGARGGAIPPNATLVFEMELLKIER